MVFKNRRRPAFYKIKLPVFHENCPILEVLVKKKTQVEPEGLLVAPMFFEKNPH
jgi:hypothetical protein